MPSPLPSLLPYSASHTRCSSPSSGQWSLTFLWACLLSLAGAPWCCAMPPCAVLSCACYAALCCAVLCCLVHAVLRCAVLCCLVHAAALCCLLHAVLLCAVALQCAMLLKVKLHQTWHPQHANRNIPRPFCLLSNVTSSEKSILHGIWETLKIMRCNAGVPCYATSCCATLCYAVTDVW